MQPVIETRTVISTRTKLFVLFLKVFVRPVLRHAPFHPSIFRVGGALDTAGRLLPAPRGTRTEKVPFEGFQAEWVHGRGSEGSHRVILYFHGGGFMSCGLRTHRRMISRISSAAGAPALSIAYRQIIPPAKITCSFLARSS
ncbi:MAG: alpha/beta hydrolase [Streptosporangiaceae bacterium]